MTESSSRVTGNSTFQILTPDNVMQRVFTIHDQHNFALLSGDYNPMHLDPVRARREMFGGVVVHGIHGFLWALDQAITEKSSIESAKCRFQNPMRIDQPVIVQVTRQFGHVELRINDSAGKLLTEAQVVFGNREPGQQPAPNNPRKSEPDDCRIENIDHRWRSIPLQLDVELGSQLFGNLFAKLPAIQMAEILALTTIVGMKTPGLQSIFSGFDVEFGPGRETDLQYRVAVVREKFSMADLEVAGPTLKGSLKTFFRPRPRTQPGFLAIRQLTGDQVFSWKNGLVVGGSRGLGEVTAKIIAATGGIPTITWRTGQDDARRVQKEIVDGGGQCEVMHLEVEQPELPALSFESLYYFASPKILRHAGEFDTGLYEAFREVYVRHFQRIVQHTTGLKYVFYPSTTFLDESTTEFAEYTRAKLEGELVCQQFNPDPKVEVVRIARTATDQTLTLTRLPVLNPVDVMREIMFPEAAACAGSNEEKS